MQRNYQYLSDDLILTQARFLPNQDWLVNGAILKGEKTTVVWDTLSKPDDLRFIDELIPLDHRVIAVYSHADWDHCWGTGAFPFDAIMAHQATTDRFANELPSLLRRYQKRYGDFFADVTLEPPDVIFDQPVSLDLGGKTLDLIPCPSHTIDSIFAFCPEIGALLVGDAVETVPEITNPRLVPDWIAALRNWASDPRVRLVVPGHGDVGGAERLTETADYLSALIEGKTISMTKQPAAERSVHRANVKKMKTL